MSGYTTENKFVIAEGDEGDLYIFLQAKKEHPDEPRVIYDGYDHAIFMRRPEERIILRSTSFSTSASVNPSSSSF